VELGRSDRDLPALTVLGLLTLGPRHTYEMHRMMIDYHKDFVTGLPRSMYHAVERLLRDGHIRVVETVREAGRPERTVYDLTDDGRASLAARIRRLLAVPDNDAALFVAALSFIGCLPVPEAVDALHERLGALDASRRTVAQSLDATRGVLPRMLLVEAEFTLARVTAEHEFVTGLVADLASGALDPTEVGDMPSRP